MLEHVTFVTNSSLTYLDECDESFDLIFLDGDHSAAMVYQEVPRALRRLREPGLLLLHDFFPNNRPLWSDRAVVPGPLRRSSDWFASRPTHRNSPRRSALADEIAFERHIVGSVAGGLSVRQQPSSSARPSRR